MIEQKTTNSNSEAGILNYWIKSAPEASLQAVETEVASLKKSVSDGKTLVAGAITDKGITTATDAAFATMADNISQISTLAVDTADATATAAQILSGKRAYVKGAPVVGTMPNNGGVSAAISSGSLKAGYTTGGAIANLVASNVKQGVNIGGVAGSYVQSVSSALSAANLAYKTGGPIKCYKGQTEYVSFGGFMLVGYITVRSTSASGTPYGYLFIGNKFYGLTNDIKNATRVLSYGTQCAGWAGEGENYFTWESGYGITLHQTSRYDDYTEVYWYGYIC